METVKVRQQHLRHYRQQLLTNITPERRQLRL